jgi:hypothetical protein
MKVSTKSTFAKFVADLNELAMRHAAGSALQGLTVLAGGFAVLLDMYAAPNPENPEGMCDDWFKFRNHFAEIMLAAPRATPKKAAKKGGRK